jgi:hypothetical protein
MDFNTMIVALVALVFMFGLVVLYVWAASRR